MGVGRCCLGRGPHPSSPESVSVITLRLFPHVCLPKRLLVLSCLTHPPVHLPAPSSVYRALISFIPLSQILAASL